MAYMVNFLWKIISCSIEAPVFTVNIIVTFTEKVIKYLFELHIFSRLCRSTNHGYRTLGLELWKSIILALPLICKEVLEK